ncbi:hypothetical protein B0H13DRAFT_1927276, partial [Mycena leptocephala]
MPGSFLWFPRGIRFKSKRPIRAESIKKGASTEKGNGPPTDGQYILGGAKELASVAQIIAGHVPVPLLEEFVGVAIKVLEACEEVTTIEETVKDLQRRVYFLSVIIVDKVNVRNNVDKDLQARIKDIHSTLNSIADNLNEIKHQNKLLMIFFRNLNKDKVDGCVVRIDTAMEKFTALTLSSLKLSHQIRTEDRVREILSKYSIIASELANVNTNIAKMSTSIDRLSEAVNKLEKPHSAPQTTPRRDMPTLGKFYGRQEDVDGVVKLLANPATSRVCITGTGGMGKTNIRPGITFWVPCVEAKSADMLRRLLYAQLRITAHSYDSLDALINELGASTDRRLLLLDNLETPLFSGDEAQVKDILLRLAKLPHVALLITMTSAFSPSHDIDWQNKDLESLSAEAAQQTFKSVYPDVAEENLDELLKAIGHIPMAVYLMATIGQHSRASPTYLLQQWETSGTDMLAPVDRSIGLAVVREGMTDHALELFATLSMLPAGTTGENLA